MVASEGLGLVGKSYQVLSNLITDKLNVTRNPTTKIARPRDLIVSLSLWLALRHIVTKSVSKLPPGFSIFPGTLFECYHTN